MLEKIDNFLFHSLHLGIFLFWLYGATVYAPESPITPFLWLIAFGIVLWCVMAVIAKINGRRLEKDFKRMYEQKYGRVYR